jgi:WCCH motif
MDPGLCPIVMSIVRWGSPHCRLARRFYASSAQDLRKDVRSCRGLLGMWRAGCRQGCTCPSCPRHAQAIARASKETQLSAETAALRRRIHGESGARAVFWSVRSHNKYPGCSVKVILCNQLAHSWVKRPSHPLIGCLHVATNSRPSRQKKRLYKAPFVRSIRRANAHRTRVL